MALPLGKLAILVGAGVVGSVLAKEGHNSTVSDFFSGAFKIFLKQIRHDESNSSSTKPQNDSLLAQVNSLRQELQLLASNRSSVTIVASRASGSSKYGVIIVAIVAGYGYVWWKELREETSSSLIWTYHGNAIISGSGGDLVLLYQGWKLPDMMFATRRSLSDACNTVARQLENVYSSIAATKQKLSARIDHVDSNLDERAEVTAATREEVSELRGEMKGIGVDVQSVHHAVRTLEDKIHRIEGKQDLTNEGVRRLVDYAWSLENSRTTMCIQASPSSSSRPALETPQMTPLSRTGSLPPLPSVESPSPSVSNGSTKGPLHNSGPASGPKELHGISEIIEALSSPDGSGRVQVTEDANTMAKSSGIFGRRFSGIGVSFITRNRSTTHSTK